ncbi:hypothetical protein Tco_0535714 [Tanacetum coccineum]
MLKGKLVLVSDDGKQLKPSHKASNIDDIGGTSKMLIKEDCLKIVPIKLVNHRKVHSGGMKVNQSDAGIGGKKLTGSVNMDSKFQFKSTKHVFRTVYKKNRATTNGTKNNT